MDVAKPVGINRVLSFELEGEGKGFVGSIA
jgi:hypothetical protein